MESYLHKDINLLKKGTRLMSEITEKSLWDITSLQEIKMFMGLEDIDRTTFFILSLSGLCTCIGADF